MALLARGERRGRRGCVLISRNPTLFSQGQRGVGARVIKNEREGKFCK